MTWVIDTFHIPIVRCGSLLGRKVLALSISPPRKQTLRIQISVAANDLFC